MIRVGIYAGSFDPFHLGHYNILKKAEKIFDKVIIARGRNLDKTESSYPMPRELFGRVLSYDGLLTDFIKMLESINDINDETYTVIRGLRNSTDLQYEMTQYRYLQDLMPDINVISIFCDKEFEHISSSGIRMLDKINPELTKKYRL